MPACLRQKIDRLLKIVLRRKQVTIAVSITIDISSVTLTPEMSEEVVRQEMQAQRLIELCTDVERVYYPEVVFA